MQMTEMWEEIKQGKRHKCEMGALGPGDGSGPPREVEMAFKMCSFGKKNVHSRAAFTLVSKLSEKTG